MAEIITSSNNHSKRRNIRKSLKVDMTPMVDLGFLLITFFIFTTSMAEQKIANLIMPADGPSSNLAETDALTILLTQNNSVYIYNGSFENAIKNKAYVVTNYNVYAGLGNVIRKRQQWLQQHNKSGKNNLTLLIKPTNAATYKNVIDALDEVAINDVKKYAIVTPSQEELAFIRSFNN